MKPAIRPRARAEQERLLVIDPARNSFAGYQISELPQFLERGDGLVLNDAATLPASLRAGPELELRLMSELDDGSWLALCLGGGDHRMPTEARGTPPLLAVGTELTFAHGLSARVRALDADSPRLLYLEFRQQGAELWQALYRAARPIQYSYLQAPLALWDVQNAYAARPWAVELPSAGKPLSFELLFRIAARGVSLAHVTHAAGLSSTGDAALDARLPVAERYDLNPESAARLREIRASGGRIIAVGTSVTRALEAASTSGTLRAGRARTELLLGPGSSLRTCDGLLTGLHEPETSHFALLEAFAPRTLLERAFRHAEREGYLQHEFGDSCLILKGSLHASDTESALEWQQAG
ncbi:MAG TPA: S-adenosylmethionine:tRNA ribosyltransferase-isomerase [Polyangiaceae bacterium]|nr:S-adenosylmethionine:tRNA ribosyltransferase-isomerase [Polyangiaceae bacterium]